MTNLDTLTQVANKIRGMVYPQPHRFIRPRVNLLSLPLTAQCNYRCHFCEINGIEKFLIQNGRPYYANNMTLDQVAVFKDFIKAARIIDFGGMSSVGEPLLSPYFQNVLELVRSYNPNALLKISTNASLLDAVRTNVLIKAAPVEITFSLHAISSEIYGKVMGPDFRRVSENIGRFCEKTNRNDKVKTAINYGLGKFNYSDAEKIILAARQWGIDYVHFYPYYKSPNHFMEDVSLYDEPEMADRVMDRVYRIARGIGQKIYPEDPPYLTVHKSHTENENTKCRLCPEAQGNFLLKSDPWQPHRLAFCVCNRIVLFLINQAMEVQPEDLIWMWHHPVLNWFRSNCGEIPEICAFCRDPGTASLRSLNHSEYKNKRDRAVREVLSRFQESRRSPSDAIELLSENIFSIP